MDKNEKTIVFLLAAINFTQILDFVNMVPLSIYLIPDLHISAFQFSTLVASYSISAFFSGIIAALLIDRHDRKKTLLIAFTGFLIGSFACGIAPNYVTLLVARIVSGTFGGLLGAQLYSIVADIFSYERRGRAMGIVMSAFAIASVIGIPLSLLLTNFFNSNWHIPFLSNGLFGLLLLPFMLKYLPPMKGHITSFRSSTIFGSLTNPMKIPIQRSALIFSCLFMFGHFLVIPFIPSYLEFNKGFTKLQIPLILLCGGLTSFAAAIYLGRFSDKKGKLPIFLWSVFISLFLVLFLTNMPPINLPSVLLFFAVLFMVVTSRIVMAQSMISNVVSQNQRGSFMSVNGSMQQLGQGMASLIAGVIVKTNRATHQLSNYNWVGYLSVAVLIVAVIIGNKIFKTIDKAADTPSGDEQLLKSNELVLDIVE
ncbi:MAG TPA: MFS transporter [Chitinophagaceae bacterium]|jgi:predicted MFS family arabinose efflux permease|nr:MFS transporter [Chitinophagaceae bacterium]